MPQGSPTFVTMACPVDPAFVALACSWMQSPATRFLEYIWQAYDDTKTSPLQVDTRDLERSITQSLEPRIRKVMTGYEPFFIQHGPYERETMQPPPAQPPQYDLAFVFRADERVMWPIEAKVLETSGRVAAYVHDVEHEFLTCRYAPFSDSGAMLGYLLSGNHDDVFQAIELSRGYSLHPVTEHCGRAIRRSSHNRMVSKHKPYPPAFDCYHVIFEFPCLRRSAQMNSQQMH